MAEIQVKPWMGVKITSTVDASVTQRFIVFRRLAAPAAVGVCVLPYRTLWKTYTTMSN